MNQLPNEIIDCILKLQSYAKERWGNKLVCYDCGEDIVIPPIMVGSCIQIGTGRCTCNRQHEDNLYEWELKLSELVTSPEYFLKEATK